MNENNKENNKVFAKRSGMLSAGTLSLLLVLGGCGGGGGGGGSGGITRTTVFPSLDDTTEINGFVAPYALDTVTPDLDSVQITVFGDGQADSSQITITVEDITLPPPPSPPDPPDIEPGFVVTFDLNNGGSLLIDGPLQGLCPDCLKTVKVAADPLPGATSEPGEVTFVYLVPSALGLEFSTLGMWSKLTTVDNPTWTEVGGPFSAGVIADAALLPSSGIANYDGFFIGRFATASDPGSLPDGTYLVGANALAVADFGVGQVTFSTSSTNISKEGAGGVLATPVLESRLNITNTVMTIERSNASFSGTIGTTTNDFQMSGNIAGGFYGPPVGAISAPQELGGAVAVGNGNQSMVGSFGLKQQ